MFAPEELHIQKLGECQIDTPLLSDGPPRINGHANRGGRMFSSFLPDDATVLFEDRVLELKKLKAAGMTLERFPCFELAGPRKKIYFNPQELTCGIVTCGGLCPGLNDVIHGLVMGLWFNYGVRNILGFRYGYEGLSSCEHEPMPLTPMAVADIHERGGTILGSSRGSQKTPEIVDTLERLGVKVLFTIGGDGTQRGAMDILREVRRRGSEISIVGIPKTIDNDILWIDKSFGFETAFSKACEAVISAHTEARCAPNGVGLVKLMGRNSGSIACHTALATSHANFVLIPEVPFELERFLAALKDRLASRKHACIITAEGAGQELMQDSDLGCDASGNRKLKDIGLFLKQKIGEYLKAEGVEHTVKYIDPSYIIRSIPATPKDSLYCLMLAHAAVHAAMTGRTGLVVGRRRERFVHVPMELVTMGKQCVDPDGDIWMSVLEITGQREVFED